MKSLKSLLALAVAIAVSSTALAEENVLSEVKEDAKSAWQTVKEDSKAAGTKIKNGAVKVKETTKEKFGEAKDATKEKFSEVKDATKEKFSEVKDATKEKLTEAKEVTQEKVAEGKKAIKDKLRNDKPAQVEDKSTAKEKSAVENKAQMTQGKKVDVNTADVAALESLSGIGEAKAKAIIEYREKNGKFKNLDDLSKVPGIGDATLEKMKSHVRFN